MLSLLKVPTLKIEPNYHYLEPLDDEAHGGELTASVANQLVTQGTWEHLNNQ